jgi:23S rRNA (cytosine1962-C5)-methyltransferase
MDRVQVILKPGKDQSAHRLHPWIFSGAIDKISGSVDEGDLVDVYDSNRQFLASGHYQIGSIAIRILTFKKEEIGLDFWKRKIEAAVLFRKQTLFNNRTDTNVYRLINAEGDGLPGLVVDFYNGTAVVQMHSIGMYLSLEQIIAAMKMVLKDQLQAVYNKSESTLPFKAKIKSNNGYVFGTSAGNEVLEYGNRFKVDWEEGQKTGFFIDQRENRRLLQTFCQDKKVLNLFGYTGGFSIYALRGGAVKVDTVDSSSRAIMLANENVELNFPGETRHHSVETDVFDMIQKIHDQYDVVILDPPAFAKHNDALKNALQGYKRLNAKVIENIRKGGILFTFSCSQVVSRENFRKSVFAASAAVGRHVRIIQQLTQPADHPVSMFHPEGEYLKGLVLYIE